MEQIILLLKNTDLKSVMWVIPALFMLHELEEWNIMDWYKNTYKNPPSSTHLSCRIWLCLMCVLGFTLTAISYIIPNNTVSACVIMVLVVFTTFNGFQHIYWTVAFKKYAPGVIFSSLGIIAGIAITIAAVSQGIVHIAFVAVLYSITVPFMIETFKAKNSLIKSFKYLHAFTLKIVAFLEA